MNEVLLVKDLHIERLFTFLTFSRHSPWRYEASGFRKVRLDPDRQFRREAEFVPIETCPEPGRRIIAPRTIPAPEREREPEEARAALERNPAGERTQDA